MSASACTHSTSGSIKWPHVDLLALLTIVPSPYSAPTGEGNRPRAHPRLHWTLSVYPNFFDSATPLTVTFT